MEVPGGLLAGAAVALVLGGAALGWLTGTSGAPPAPLAAPEAAPEVRVTPAGPGTVPAAEPALDTCAAELTLLRGAYAALEEEAFGAPRSFPDDVPPAFQPEGFREAVDALVRECPELNLTRPYVDCDEYPCQVFFLVGPEGASGMDSRGLNRCAEWDRRMEGAAAAVGSNVVHLDGQTRRVVGFAPTPTDDVPPDNASKRTFYRFRQNHERFADAVGGRPLTELEKAEQQVRFWEGQVDANEDPARQEFLDLQLERLRARRAALQDGGGD